MGSEKNEYQRLADTRAKDDGATSPVVAAASACLCYSKSCHAGTQRGLNTTLGSRTGI